MTIEAPRSPRRTRSRSSGVEANLWLFQRVSGVALVVLLLGHLFTTTLLDGGVQRVNWAYLAGRWASPFWQLWDLLLIWLGLLHGAIGLRTVVQDYARRPATRLALKLALYSATAAAIALGSLVILTFDPTIS